MDQDLSPLRVCGPTNKQTKQSSDGIGTLPTYISREPHWNLMRKAEEDTETVWKMAHQNKNYKNNLVPVERPFISEKSFTWHPMYPIQCHLIIQITTPGVCIHTNNVSIGPAHQQRCYNVSYAWSQVQGPHNHIFVSHIVHYFKFLYFTYYIPLKLGYSLTQS